MLMSHSGVYSYLNEYHFFGEEIVINFLTLGK